MNDGGNKGRFELRDVPVVEKEGERSERHPKSDRDVDHETHEQR